MKTFSLSLYDYYFKSSGKALPTSSDWSYDPTYEEQQYDDPYLSFNILDKIDSTWYNVMWNGETTYYWQWISAPANPLP